MEAMFDKLYDSKDGMKAEKKELVRNRVKRQFEAARDSAKDAKIEAELKMMDARGDLAELDLNRVLSYRQRITDAQATIEAVHAEYEVMFGEKLSD